ncbi:MAG: glycosyltransferase family 2 protein, partial [Acidobacteriota bacterium]|nr:glycosyltransferase family 2 protein [Acidobacteriota bacterium]
MIVKNERARLPRCLDSVGDLCREIVIVDTGSTDGTREVAMSYGARVSSYDFAVIDFAAARNYALDRATGRWVLVLDADEVLQRASAPLVRDLVGLNLNAGYYVERVNRHADPMRAMVDFPLRLFPNRPDYR